MIDFEDSSDQELVNSESVRFNEMDKNKDGKLSKDEVRETAFSFSIITLASAEANKLMLKVDQNKDDVLSHAEIVANYPAFTEGKKLDTEKAQHERHDEL